MKTSLIVLSGLILCLATSGATFALTRGYYRSSIPDYHEVEPLYPLISDFSDALSQKTRNKKLELSDLESLMAEDRFSQLRSYGFVLSDKEGELIILRINKNYSFSIRNDHSARMQLNR